MVVAAQPAPFDVERDVAAGVIFRLHDGAGRPRVLEREILDVLRDERDCGLLTVLGRVARLGGRPGVGAPGGRTIAGHRLHSGF